MGRPSKYSEELITEICSRLSEGEPLRAICRDGHMPNWTTVYEWMKKDTTVSQRIALARELGADAIAEDILQIIDTPLIGERTESTKDGVKVISEDMLGHRKLQAEYRLKLLAKWFPKKYGEKISQEISGPDGGPVQISETERAAKIKALLNAAKQRKDNDGSDLV